MVIENRLLNDNDFRSEFETTRSIGAYEIIL